MLLQPNLLNTSFYLTYLSLTASSLLTGFSLISSKEDCPKRNIMILETTVTIIAAIIYYMFINYINQPNKSLGLITNLRYLDWVITTPLLLISFCLYLHYKKNKDEEKPISQRPLFWIIIFNMAMLIFGYLGETNQINKYWGNGLGFVCLLFVFWFIYKKYVISTTQNEFLIFAIIWSLYGVVFFFPVVSKNISYNILDIIAKAGFSLYFLTTFNKK